MYAVFGVNMETAIMRAEKLARIFDEDGRPLNVQEYRAIVEKKALKIYKTMKPFQLSPIYSNLSEARQYRDLARKAGFERMVIRRRMQTVDGEGKPVLHKVSKRPVMYWDDVGVAE